MRKILDRFLSMISNVINHFDSYPPFQMSTLWIINDLNWNFNQQWIDILSYSASPASSSSPSPSGRSTIARRLGVVTTPMVTITLNSGPRQMLVVRMNMYLYLPDANCHLWQMKYSLINIISIFLFPGSFVFFCRLWDSSLSITKPLTGRPSLSRSLSLWVLSSLWQADIHLFIQMNFSLYETHILTFLSNMAYFYLGFLRRTSDGVPESSGHLMQSHLKRLGTKFFFLQKDKRGNEQNQNRNCKIKSI